MPNEEIEELKNQFVKTLNPLKIYLFGSFANGTATKDSDFDFYIVVDNSVSDLWGAMDEARASIVNIQKRPIDILVGTQEKFDRRKNLVLSIERQVNENGVVLYESRS